MSDPILGMEIHQSIQSERAENSDTYRAEVPVFHSFVHGKWTIEVSGRVDGVDFEGGTVICEEIKSTWSPRRLMRAIESNPLHPYSLQASLYAYIYSLNHKRKAIPRLLVVSAMERSVEVWEGGLNDDDMPKWLEERFEILIAQEVLRQKFVKARRKMAAEVEFPFATPRAGQVDLSAAVAKVVAIRGRLMVQAPTGLGKSVGVLYPVLKDALERGSKVIYTTPKNSQHTVAEEACNQWRKAGVKISSVTVSAKAKICMKDEQKCNPDYCEFARDHYDKVAKSQLLEKLARKTEIDASLLREYAARYEVCPYELGMQAIARADVVICDYNYAFSPAGSIVERCHAGVNEKPKLNVIVDEAHNLYGRAMEYFSPSVTVSSALLARSEIHALPESVRVAAVSALDAAIGIISSFAVSRRDKSDAAIIQPTIQPFMEVQSLLTRIVSDCADLADKLAFPDGENPLQSFLWQWSTFTESLLTLTDEYFCTYAVVLDDEVLQIHCCNASVFLAERMKQFHSTIAFSATLKPFEFYARLTGFDVEKDQSIEFTSPFPSVNRKILVIPQVSTSYEKRSSNYGKIADAIQRIVSVKSGNYFVFFPSFDFMREVASLLSVDGFEIERQSPGTTNDEARRRLQSFKRRTNMVVLAVQGGVYAEGVDLPGDQLIGSLIVGPAVPPFSLVREQMRRYYQKKFGSGFEYAYTYPAMSRVVQAAGRVIRTGTDRGIIVLFDKRFVEPQYTRCMPGDWFNSDVKELVSRTILADVRDFWLGRVSSDNEVPDSPSSVPHDPALGP